MSKYNNKKVMIDGISFDSKVEGKYYEYLKRLNDTLKIKSFRLQPEFILQPKFKKNGKSFREIKYIADFEVVEPDGSIYIVDIKGMLTTEFKLKAKLFHYTFPAYDLRLLRYVAKYGGWITVEEHEKLKKGKKK